MRRCLCGLLVIGYTLIGVINAENREDDSGNSTFQVVFVGLLAAVTLVSVLLLCAGDKVEHSDRENTKRHHQTKTTIPSSKKHRQSFEEVEVEFSHQRKTGANEHVSHSPLKRNDEKFSHNGFERTPPAVKLQLSRENAIVTVNDESEISQNGGHTSKSIATREYREAPYNSDTSTPIITPPTYEETSRSDRVTINSSQSHTDNRHQGDGRNSNYGRQSIGSMRNNNRQNTEDTGDDIGYHSDFSKSVKQDTDSNQLSTFRSSHIQSNARSVTSYDIDDDAIETYNDDGQSIDWN